MSAKVKRLVNKAKHSTSLLARHVESLHSRFNLRRVIIAADKRSAEKGQARSDEDVETIHRFVCAETRIADLWPPWRALGPAEQRQLCGFLRHRVVPLGAPSPVVLPVPSLGAGPSAGGAGIGVAPDDGLWIVLCGDARLAAPAAAAAGGDGRRLAPGDCAGGAFVPSALAGALAADLSRRDREEALLGEWDAENRRDAAGAATAPDTGAAAAGADGAAAPVPPVNTPCLATGAASAPGSRPASPASNMFGAVGTGRLSLTSTLEDNVGDGGGSGGGSDGGSGDGAVLGAVTVAVGSGMFGDEPVAFDDEASLEALGLGTNAAAASLGAGDSKRGAWWVLELGAGAEYLELTSAEGLPLVSRQLPTGLGV